MKKYFISLTLLLVCTWGFTQQVPGSDKKLTAEKYIQKSHSQKTLAWICLGGSVACLIAPSIIQGSSDSDNDGEFLGGVDHSADPYLYAGGAGLAIGSALLFSAASRNKKKAAALNASFQFIKTEELVVNKISSRLDPGVTLTFPFRNKDHF